MNNVQIELGIIENSCFVIMPFNSVFQTEYEKIIQPALNELNIECVRGDEIYTKQRIVDDIWASIRKCRFVLAELTNKNPNVLYELGLAHAIGKPAIIITRNSEDVPFDLKSLRYLYYNVDEPFWGENLKIGIQNLVKKILDNPTIENYLEGITQSKNIKFPKISLIENIEAKNDFPDIDGTWIGSFYDNFQNEKREVKVTLQIDQKQSILTGNSVITYSIQGETTVVQQIMNGSIKAGTILLHGVNYTFVERGLESSYVLDTFKLTLSADKQILIGEIICDPTLTTVEPEIKLHRF
jgi:hypothetical protein